MNMYQQGHKKNLMQIGLAEQSRRMICEDLALTDYESVITDEVLTFRFLAGTLIWLDITSSIMAGSEPHLFSYHSDVIGPNSQTRLEDVMGCENWVMLQISRITALAERKTRASQERQFNSAEFDEIVSEIATEIQRGLFPEKLHIAERDSAAIFSTPPDALGLVTLGFAYMASVYLHLVTHGFQKLALLDTTIAAAMKLLQFRIPRHLLPALVCPLFVIGSAVKKENEQFFRDIFSSSPLLNPSIGHRSKILPVLEEIWCRRRTIPGFVWRDSLELTDDILLL